jgi:tellurite resistance protein
VTAIVAGAFGRVDWGQLAFGAGFFSWLAIESVVLHRLLTTRQLPAPLRPTLGIQLTPPAVGCLAYLRTTSGTPDAFSHALLGYALLQLLILARLMQWIGKQPFDLSYWGATFGLTALANASLRMAGRGDGGAVLEVALCLFVTANVVVAAIGVRSLHWLAKGAISSATQAPPNT